MKLLMVGIASLLLVATVSGAYFAGLIPLRGGSPCALNQVGSIPLPNLSGRIDHMAFDPKGQTLYVAALDNNSVNVVNVTSDKLERIVEGFSAPQGVLFLQRSDSIYVTNAGNGIVNVLDAGSRVRTANISLGSDADNIRYDPSSNLVYVGYGQGAIAVVNASNKMIIETVQLAGHPEGFQLAPGSKQIFVNVASSGYVAVVDATANSVTTRWPLANATGNYPMGLDEVHGRLFIGTRTPPQFVVLDSTTGKNIATLSLPPDPDDIYYDASNGCAYISSGSGHVTIVRESDPSHYAVVAQIATSPGARTSLLAAETGLFFVAAPAAGSTQAAILVYKTS